MTDHHLKTYPEKPVFSRLSILTLPTRRQNKLPVSPFTTYEERLSAGSFHIPIQASENRRAGCEEDIRVDVDPVLFNENSHDEERRRPSRNKLRKTVSFFFCPLITCVFG
jgi:hypothetical protein